MTDYVPPEVVNEILKRLPVRSLLRFRCVCREWRSLISSPDFIAAHLHQALSSGSNDSLLVRQYSKVRNREIYSLHLDNGTFDCDCAEIELPFEDKSDYYFRIVDYCNGLLCLSDDLFGYGDTIILWNPSIGRSLKLPIPSFVFERGSVYMSVLGFGFHPKSNDPKVLKMVYVQGERGYLVPPVVEVFELSTGNWKNVEYALPYFVPEYFWSQAFINGHVHWVAHDLNTKHGERNFCNLIVSFDMGSDEFGELNLPESLVSILPWNLCTVIIGGSLSVIQYDERMVSTRCFIWIMEEYGVVGSWTNQFNIHLEGGLGRALGLRRNGEMLLSTRSGELVSYNSGTQRGVQVGIHGTKDSFFIDRYMESLILIEKGNTGSGGQAGTEESSPWSSEDESGEEDDFPRNPVEMAELWRQAIVEQFLSALLHEN